MNSLIIPLTSYDIFEKVVRAFGIVYSENGIDIKDLILKTGCKKNNIYRNLSFLEEINFITSIDEKYLLTDIGKQYSDFLDNNQNEQAYEVIKEALLNYKQIQFIINYVKLERKISHNDLKNRIIELIGVSSVKKIHNAGINCLIQLLLNTRIINKENDFFVIG